MKTLYFYLGLFFTLLSVSCHKKHTEPVPTTNCYITQVSYKQTNFPISIYAYTYDANNRIIEKKDSVVGGNSNITTYTYNALGKIIRSAQYAAQVQSNYSVYIYNSNNVIVADTTYGISNGTPFVSSYSSYTYDNSGRITNSNLCTFQYTSDTVYATKEFISYTYDNNGNVLSALYDSTNDGYTYTYDNNPRVITDIDRVSGIPQSLSRNNVTSIISNSLVINLNQSITYTYNSNNYPATSVLVATVPYTNPPPLTAQFKITSFTDTTTYTYNCH